MKQILEEVAKLGEDARQGEGAGGGWQGAARHGPQCRHHRRLCGGLQPHLVDHPYSGTHIGEAGRHDLQDRSLS